MAAQEIENPAAVVIKCQRSAKGIHCGSECVLERAVQIKPYEYFRSPPGSTELTLETLEIDAR